MDALLVEILRQISEFREEFREYRDRNDQRMRALLLTMQAERKDAVEHRARSAAPPAPAPATVPPPVPEPSPSSPAHAHSGAFTRSLAAHVAAGGWPSTIVILAFVFPFLFVVVAVVAWATGTPLPAIIAAFGDLNDAAAPL